MDSDVISCMDLILKKYNLILQAKEALSTGKSLSKKLQDALRSKSSVVHQLSLLDEVLKEYPFQLQTAKESELTKPRYLYVSDGLVICLLDLQKRKFESFSEYMDADNVRSLPKVSLLRMLDHRDPLSSGVLNLVLPPGCPDGITSHLVVASRIYAATAGSKHVLIYDSEDKKWISSKSRKDFHPFCIKRVWDFIHHGSGRCVGEFLVESGDPVFVVIAIVRNVAGFFDTSVHVVAYLVTSLGRVICFQRLPHFYEERIRPRLPKAAAVINADEQGRVMCAIVQGRAPFDFDQDGRRYLFINTFFIEPLPEACSKVGELRERMNEYSIACEMEFVRVVVQDRYMYKMDTESEFAGQRCELSDFPFLQACFISP